MPFPGRAPKQPPFLVDITDKEIKGDNFIHRKLVFNSGPPKTAAQHTINGIQFEDGDAFIKIVMGAVEEWTIQNTTNNVTGPKGGGGIIDHPLHIHINPFQVSEFFDPNQKMTNDKGQLIGKKDPSGRTQPIPVYRIKGQPGPVEPGQCELDPDQPSTWVPCPSAATPPKSVWWDVFAIPSGRGIAGTGGKPNIVIPGYYKMRSRFVDYKGLYVLHCHILIHEDRGMMFSVQVVKPDPVFVRHH
jgi:FtsP/CotA-like multicopper oxidase with cupredoxin domain